jgi:hypothetical protein
MRNSVDLSDPSYTPGKLLDEFGFVARAENACQIARALEVDPAVISRILSLQAPVSDGLMVRIMDRTGWSIQYVRQLMGVPFDEDPYPPRVRRVEPPKGRIYHTAKEDILQSMPGTASELAKRAGYHREHVYCWLRKLRRGDPMTRESHIIGWQNPTGPNGSGDYTPIHAAGPGEDAPRIVLSRCRAGQRIAA